MAYSYTQYTVASSNDTTTTYATPPYRSGKAATDISVAVDGVTKTATIEYTVSGTSVTFTSAGAPLAGSIVRVARNTSQNAAPSTYSENTILTSAQLNATQEQLFFMAQEAIDTASETNLAGSTFYSSSNTEPTSPSLGDLWYDTFNKYLQIYNGTSFQLATPANETLTFTSFTAESGTYSYISVASVNSDSFVFLNGVKQVRDTVKTNLLASSGAKDYFIDDTNKRVYFKTLASDSVVQIILAPSSAGANQSTVAETFTATAGQTVFNLTNTFLPATNTLHVYVNGVRQTAYTETDGDTVTFTNGLTVGDEVVFVINQYSVLQSYVDSLNVTHTPAGTGAVASTLKATLDNLTAVPRTSAPSAAPSSLGNHSSITTAFSGDISAIQVPVDHRITGAATLGQPTSGYTYTPEAYPHYTFLFNSSGHNNSTSTNTGRTAAVAYRTAVAHTGDGDGVAYNASVIASGSKASASHWLASPAAVLYNGDAFAGAANVYLNLTEFQADDQGVYECSGVGAVYKMKRNVDRTSLEHYWAGVRVQSTGTKQLDDGFVVSGHCKTGINTVRLASLSQAALAIKADQRLYLNAAVSGSSNFDINLNDTYITYDSTSQSLVLRVGGFNTLALPDSALEYATIASKFQAKELKATDAGSGLVVTSPNGSVTKKISIDNSGNVVAVAV